MDKEVQVCGETYRIIRLLGHGKGGYSYLAEKERPAGCAEADPSRAL